MIRSGNTVAIDRHGVLTGSSTDSLHALWYLRKEDVDPETLANIVDHLEALATDVGYSTANIQQRGTYHNNVVWSFEQVPSIWVRVKARVSSSFEEVVVSA